MEGKSIGSCLGVYYSWEDMINRHRQAAPTEHLIVTGWVEYAKLTLKSCMHARRQKIIEMEQPRRTNALLNAGPTRDAAGQGSTQEIRTRVLLATPGQA
jgi:hypothetical protein